jgi:hypothetical protein
MVVMKRREDAEPDKRPATTPEGLTFDVTPYFGSTVANAGAPHPGLGVLHPVAVRIDQRPNTVNAPHFHQANQFQVFVGGDGLVGKHRVGGVTIHYAQAYTPYGPLCSSERGLSYFVLRNSWDPIAQFMPAKRELLKAAGRRPRTVMSATLEPAGAPLPAGVSCTPALEPQADGLGAWRFRAPAGATFAGPAPASGGGQFWLVLAGADRAGETALTPMSCLFVSPDEPPRNGEAGMNGLDVLVLQFPRLDDAPPTTTRKDTAL